METGIFDQGVLFPVSLWDVPDAPTLPYRILPIFRDPFVDYGPKSIWWPERTPLKSESGKIGLMDYQWQSSVFRGCFYQVMMQSPSSYRILGRVPCYVASCSQRLTDSAFLSRFRSVSAPRSCTRDEGRPLGAGLQEQASNHLKLLW